MNLTLADVYGISGKEFVTNNVATEDFIGRLLYMLPVRWPADVLVVSTAASALACRYYGLDAKQTKVAPSYGATNSTSPGNSYYDYCQEFMYHNGVCAQTGIMSAELAKGGWRGLEDPIFGRNGIISSQIKDGALPPLYEKAFEGLGSVYFTEESFKRGPGGIPTTAAAKCGAALHNKIAGEYGTFDAENVLKVHVSRSKSVNYNYYSNPFVLRNHTNALFSFQFSACCALIYGRIPLAAVQTPAINADSQLLRLSEESTMDVFTDEAGRQLMRVAVEMKDGRKFEAVEEYSASMHEYPTKAFLLAKFWDQFDTFGKLPHSAGEKIIELAGRIEELSDMREYTSLLTL
jgi:2-methylcitrate dehydratase PrpD